MGMGGTEADLIDLDGIECTSMRTWDVSSVTDFSQMLYDLSSKEIIDETFQSKKAVFNVPIGNWDTSAAKNMDSALRGAAKFNQPLFWNTAVSNHHCPVFIHSFIHSDHSFPRV